MSFIVQIKDKEVLVNKTFNILTKFLNIKTIYIYRIKRVLNSVYEVKFDTVRNYIITIYRLDGQKQKVDKNGILLG